MLAAAQREHEQAHAVAALSAQQATTEQMRADRDKVLAAAHREEQVLHTLQAREAALIRAARPVPLD